MVRRQKLKTNSPAVDSTTIQILTLDLLAHCSSQSLQRHTLISSHELFDEGCAVLSFSHYPLHDISYIDAVLLRFIKLGTFPIHAALLAKRNIVFCRSHSHIPRSNSGTVVVIVARSEKNVPLYETKHIIIIWYAKCSVSYKYCGQVYITSWYFKLLSVFLENRLRQCCFRETITPSEEGYAKVVLWCISMVSEQVVFWIITLSHCARLCRLGQTDSRQVDPYMQTCFDSFQMS